MPLCIVKHVWYYIKQKLRIESFACFENKYHINVLEEQFLKIRNRLPFA